MPFLLILVSLLFVSCKKENQIAGKIVSNLEQRSFLTIKHEDHQSVIRSKILNSFVEEKYPDYKAVNQIQKNDELQELQVDERDLMKYAELERSMAKVVVSYTDRLEIYFLPENIPLNQIISKLNLAPEADRVFKWKKTEAIRTYAGLDLYLASVNVEDIALNDQKFYQKNVALKNLKIASGQLIEVEISYNYFIQKEKVQKFKGKAQRCTPDMIEAGMCGACEYSRMVAGDEYTAFSLPAISDLRLNLNFGGQLYKAEDLNPVINGNQFTIKLEDIDGVLEIISNETLAVTKNSMGFDYGQTCISRNEGGSVVLQTKAELNIVFKVFGRGTSYFKNIL